MVFVVSEDGKQLGSMNKKQAIELAEKDDLDLVCVSPTMPMPVCKLMDYGKYRFDQLKKEKQIKKNQMVSSTSEIQIGMNTQVHDLETKMHTCERLLKKKGNSVRIVLRMNGRESNMSKAALSQMEFFINMCSSFSKVKTPPVIDGRDVRAVIETI